MEKEAIQQCPYCEPGKTPHYCSACAQPLHPKRLTFKGMLHEMFHFFSHLDKGFPYTLKKLITAPGTMQREYIDGKRSAYQKPFSMYFICASFCALAFYLIITSLMRYYHAGDSEEATFFNKYWVILQVCMMPLYAFITWLFFKNERLNYAEILIFQLYVFSFLFLLITVIQLLKFAWPGLQTRYIELPAIIAYTLVTNLNFFTGKQKWLIIVKTILAIAISFSLASLVQDQLIRSLRQG
jgi:hypothetical protein